MNSYVAASSSTIEHWFNMWKSVPPDSFDPRAFSDGMSPVAFAQNILSIVLSPRAPRLEWPSDNVNSDAFIIEYTLRACDGLGACTNSTLARAEPDGIVGPDLHLTWLRLLCSPPCAGATPLEVVPCAVGTASHGVLYHNRVCLSVELATFGRRIVGLYAGPSTPIPRNQAVFARIPTALWGASSTWSHVYASGATTLLASDRAAVAAYWLVDHLITVVVTAVMVVWWWWLLTWSWDGGKWYRYSLALYVVGRPLRGGLRIFFRGALSVLLNTSRRIAVCCRACERPQRGASRHDDETSGSDTSTVISLSTVSSVSSLMRASRSDASDFIAVHDSQSTGPISTPGGLPRADLDDGHAGIINALSRSTSVEVDSTESAATSSCSLRSTIVQRQPQPLRVRFSGCVTVLSSQWPRPSPVEVMAELDAASAKSRMRRLVMLFKPSPAFRWRFTHTGRTNVGEEPVSLSCAPAPVTAPQPCAVAAAPDVMVTIPPFSMLPAADKARVASFGEHSPLRPRSILKTARRARGAHRQTRVSGIPVQFSSIVAQIPEAATGEHSDLQADPSTPNGAELRRALFKSRVGAGKGGRLGLVRPPSRLERVQLAYRALPPPNSAQSAATCAPQHVDLAPPASSTAERASANVGWRPLSALNGRVDTARFQPTPLIDRSNEVPSQVLEERILAPHSWAVLRLAWLFTQVAVAVAFSACATALVLCVPSDFVPASSYLPLIRSALRPIGSAWRHRFIPSLSDSDIERIIAGLPDIRSFGQVPVVPEAALFRAMWVLFVSAAGLHLLLPLATLVSVGWVTCKQAQMSTLHSPSSQADHQGAQKS